MKNSSISSSTSANISDKGCLLISSLGLRRSFYGTIKKIYVCIGLSWLVKEYMNNENEEKLPRMMTLLVGLGRMADMLADEMPTIVRNVCV